MLDINKNKDRDKGLIDNSKAQKPPNPFDKAKPPDISGPNQKSKEKLIYCLIYEHL